MSREPRFYLVAVRAPWFHPPRLDDKTAREIIAAFAEAHGYEIAIGTASVRALIQLCAEAHGLDVEIRDKAPVGTGEDAA